MDEDYRCPFHAPMIKIHTGHLGRAAALASARRAIVTWRP